MGTHPIFESDFDCLTDLMADSDVEFENVDAGSSDRYPSQASALRKGGHVIIRDTPCKIVDMSTSKTGKHGHAKVHFVAIDIFTGKKLEELCPSTHNVQSPKITRMDLGLIDITDENYCS